MSPHNIIPANEPARFTSRPSGGGSRLEAVFRFPRVESWLFLGNHSKGGSGVQEGDGVWPRAGVLRHVSYSTPLVIPYQSAGARERTPRPKPNRACTRISLRPIPQWAALGTVVKAKFELHPEISCATIWHFARLIHARISMRLKVTFQLFFFEKIQKVLIWREKTPVPRTISWHANAALESSWNCTQNMLILAWLACGILIFGESARAYIWQKGQNARLAGKKICAPVDNLRSNYGIGKPLKFCIKNISFGLVTM